MILELLLTFCRELLIPLPNNTADLIADPLPLPLPPTTAAGDTTVLRLFCFFCRSPNMEAISGLTCVAPDASGKSDIWKLIGREMELINYMFLGVYYF